MKGTIEIFLSLDFFSLKFMFKNIFMVVLQGGGGNYPIALPLWIRH